MEYGLRKALLREEEAPHPIIESIRQVCRQIELVEHRFSLETDNDLIEGCIYELQALQARYRYLLRRAREQGVTDRERVHLWNE